MNKLLITQIKSLCRRTERQRACVRGLGLRRISHTVCVDDTPENRGMINAVYFLLKVEKIVGDSENAA